MGFRVQGLGFRVRFPSSPLEIRVRLVFITEPKKKKGKGPTGKPSLGFRLGVVACGSAGQGF